MIDCECRFFFYSIPSRYYTLISLTLNTFNPHIPPQMTGCWTSTQSQGGREGILQTFRLQSPTSEEQQYRKR